MFVMRLSDRRYALIAATLITGVMMTIAGLIFKLSLLVSSGVALTAVGTASFALAKALYLYSITPSGGRPPPDRNRDLQELQEQLESLD